MNYNASFLNKKRSHFEKYWHYLPVFITTMLSLGFLKDGIAIVQCLGIMDFCLIAYFMIALGKRFNILFLLLISILHESFLDCMYGVCLIAYFCALIVFSKMQKSGFVRYFRLFQEDSKMLYCVSIATFIMVSEIVLIMSGRNPLFIVGEIIVSLILVKLFDDISHRYSEKKRQFANYEMQDGTLPR